MFFARPSRTLLLSLVPLLLLAQGLSAGEAPAHQSSPLQPVQPVWSSASSGSSFVIPYFEVNLVVRSGKTLLYAIHNPFNVDSMVRVDYRDARGVVVESQMFNIAPRAVETVNLRDVLTFLPPADPDMFSRGSISITATDPMNPAVDRLIAVDYFAVTPGGNFATGDRAVPYAEMVAGPTSPFLCDLWSLRFLNGGSFDGGTQVNFFADLVSPSTDGRIEIEIYDEPGNMVGQTEISTNLATQQVPIGNILQQAGAAGTQFGVLLITFAEGTNGGHVAATYDAQDRFSVGVQGACLIE